MHEGFPELRVIMPASRDTAMCPACPRINRLFIKHPEEDLNASGTLQKYEGARYPAWFQQYTPLRCIEGRRRSLTGIGIPDRVKA